jgi:hypothetical protein
VTAATTYDEKRFTGKRMRRLGEIASELVTCSEELSQAVDEWEDADALTGEDRAEVRQSARDEAWDALSELLAEADKLREIRHQIEFRFPENENRPAPSGIDIEGRSHA